MAISTLSTIATNYFKGGSRLYGKSSNSLSGIIRTSIAKINEVISGLGDLDTLEVGTTAGYYAGGTNYAWFLVDGVNPPTLGKLRMQDEQTGNFYDLSLQTGVWTITGPL